MNNLYDNAASTPTFKAKNVVQKGNSLTLELCYETTSNSTSNKKYAPPGAMFSPEYLINGLVVFEAKLIQAVERSNGYDRPYFLYFVRFISKRDIGELTYTLSYAHKFNDPSKEDNSEQCYIKNDRWQLISEVQNSGYTVSFKFYVTVKLSISAWVDPFERIHNDTELTDLEIRGIDGSIKLHRAVAAGFSPVIKSMFTSEWGKYSKCEIDAPPGTTQETLQHLKDYMYLDTLPDTDAALKSLLLLASHYIMPDMELRCVLELATDVTPKRAYDLIEFAMKHQMTQVIYELMHSVQIGKLDANAVRKLQKW